MVGAAAITARHEVVGLNIHPPERDGATRHGETGVHHHRRRVDVPAHHLGPVAGTHHPGTGAPTHHVEPDVPIHHRGPGVHRHHWGPDVLS